MKHPEWIEWELRIIGWSGKKERSRNLEGENQERSIVPSGVANFAIGINAWVVVDQIFFWIFAGSKVYCFTLVTFVTKKHTYIHINA